MQWPNKENPIIQSYIRSMPHYSLMDFIQRSDASLLLSCFVYTMGSWFQLQICIEIMQNLILCCRINKIHYNCLEIYPRQNKAERVQDSNHVSYINKNLTSNGMRVHLISGLNDLKTVWNWKVFTLKKSNMFEFQWFHVTWRCGKMKWCFVNLLHAK